MSEKAKLVMDLEKTRASEAELASQLVIAQKELEQYKSKLRALGALVSPIHSLLVELQDIPFQK